MKYHAQKLLMFYDCTFQTCDQDKESVLVHFKSNLFLFLEDQTLHFFSADADITRIIQHRPMGA